MRCDKCGAELVALTDRILGCYCQDVLWEATAQGVPPRRLAMSPSLRNLAVRAIQVSQQSLGFAGLLTGRSTLALKAQPIQAPIGINVLAPCQQCGQPFNVFVDQFLLCGCAGRIWEATGTSNAIPYELSGPVRDTIILCAQITNLAQQLAAFVEGRGEQFVDGASFGVTATGGGRG